MKKLAAAAAAAAAVAIVVGAGVGVRAATDDSQPCNKPITLFGSEQDASIKTLETYITENVAPGLAHPEDLDWQSDDYNPTVTPGRISARIALVDVKNGLVPVGYYHVTLVRDCQGGEWKVVEFKRVKG